MFLIIQNEFENKENDNINLVHTKKFNIYMCKCYLIIHIYTKHIIYIYICVVILPCNIYSIIVFYPLQHT